MFLVYLLLDFTMSNVTLHPSAHPERQRTECSTKIELHTLSSARLLRSANMVEATRSEVDDDGVSAAAFAPGSCPATGCSMPGVAGREILGVGGAERLCTWNERVNQQKH